MAGDWIPMRTDLWNCPEVVRILSAKCPQNVRIDADKMRGRCEIVGALYRTWSLFDTYSDDGKLIGYDANILNEEVGIEGWAEDLQHIGWLVIEPQAIIMPDFSTWLGRSAKRRLRESQRKRDVRKNVSAKCPQNVRIDADKMRTTIQKRREENRERESAPAFTPPTIDDVIAFAGAHELSIDAAAFVDHYTANGWHVGRNPMKDWKAAVRGWIRRQGDFAGNGKPKQDASGEYTPY
jgi:hypothetical protein